MPTVTYLPSNEADLSHIASSMSQRARMLREEADILDRDAKAIWELMRRPAKKVHAVYHGNTKETVCEHEFSMFDKEHETWTSFKSDRQITCASCRSILRLEPLP